MKTTIASAAHWTRLDRWAGVRNGLDNAPLVVGYHRVVQDFEHSCTNAMPSMLVSTNTLEKQLDFIGKRYRFVSLDELARVVFGGEEAIPVGDNRKPVAAVTFDDGYQDVYHNALPLLKRKGIPFTAYVVSDLVGTNRLLLHDEVYQIVSQVMRLDKSYRNKCWTTLRENLGEGGRRLAPPLSAADKRCDPYRATRALLHGLSADELRQAVNVLKGQVEQDEGQRAEFLSMTWEMLRDLPQGGGTVGSHTRSHALLATEPEAVLKEELEGSKRELEQQLGTPVRHLAYPDGSFNMQTIRAAKAANYETATTICRHVNEEFPALTIARRSFWEKSFTNPFGRFSPALLSCEISGLFDVRERCSYEH